MLNYSTVEVVNPDVGLPSVDTNITILCLATIILCIIWAFMTSPELGKGTLLAVSVVMVLILGARYSGLFGRMELIKIEVSDVEMKSDIYPSVDKYPYFKKENDKVYYYTTIVQKTENDPYNINRQIEKEFLKNLFNLKNQKK